MSLDSSQFPYLGFGLGLRSKHYEYVFEHWPEIDWFEVITENFLVDGGPALHNLDRARERYPIVLHGVSLSIGSVDPLNFEYLAKVKKLAERVQPAWISDHLCWTGVDGKNLHDLLPLPYTEEALNHIVDRLKQVQDYLGRQMLIENPSSYVSFKESTMTEWDFLRTLAEEADCGILLDINNIYVSAFNHDFDPLEYLHAMPHDRVKQFHLAGHTHKGTHIIDTHDESIIEPVFELYRQALEYFPEPISTMIERDDNIPAFPELFTELQHVKSIAAT